MERTKDDSPISGKRRAEAVEAVFDEWATTGEADGMERRHQRLAELMLERIDFRPDARVLDIGCGYGWLARLLSPRIPAGAFVGIDVSREMIRRARQDCASVENALFAPAAAEEIPWAEDYFTHVVSIESAYYWNSIQLSAREMFRVTAWGGSFHILINYYKENRHSGGWDRSMGVSLHRMSAEEWASIFRDVGFEGVVTDQIPDDSPISPGKAPDELATRVGLQRVGALYLTGSKPSLPEVPAAPAVPARSPFRIFR